MSASGRNNFPCPICKKNFEDCKHSRADLDQRESDNHIRKIVREELKKMNNGSF